MVAKASFVQRVDDYDGGVFDATTVVREDFEYLALGLVIFHDDASSSV